MFFCFTFYKNKTKKKKVKKKKKKFIKDDWKLINLSEKYSGVWLKM